VSLKDYIKESKSNGIVAAFGRMNPPTNGHGLLVQSVLRYARQYKCDHVIYLSRSQDKKKNPLSIVKKLFWVKKMFPGVRFVGADEHTRTFIEMVIELNHTYDTLYLVAGSDRIPEYKKLLDKYNGKDFNYKKIEVLSAGERDPDSDDASGMSATKMREYAKNNDISNFRKGLPETVQSQAAHIIADVRSGMGL